MLPIFIIIILLFVKYEVPGQKNIVFMLLYILFIWGPVKSDLKD